MSNTQQVNLVLRPQGPAVFLKTSGVSVHSGKAGKAESLPWDSAKKAIIERYKDAPPEAKLAAARAIRRTERKLTSQPAKVAPPPVSKPAESKEEKKERKDFAGETKRD